MPRVTFACWVLIISFLDSYLCVPYHMGNIISFNAGIIINFTFSQYKHLYFSLTNLLNDSLFLKCLSTPENRNIKHIHDLIYGTPCIITVKTRTRKTALIKLASEANMRKEIFNTKL